MARLWRYNLHYFDDLNAEGAADRSDLHRELIGRWIAENPASGGTGWEPYPCSLRIVNLIKWALAGNKLQQAWSESLAVQTDWLSKNIEWHLLGNHLFANAKALVFAGLFFQGAPALRWLQIGMDIVGRELPEQVLHDGGQFERSTMYHAIAFEDVLDLINIAGSYSNCIFESVITSWSKTAEKMLAWEEVMKHPDNEIALFNDSAMHVAPVPEELEKYAKRLGLKSTTVSPGITYLSDSGYVRAENESAVLFADVGKIGPDYLPGHAHADTLSFELSLFGDRWIVDTGCSTYEASTERLRQRGTAAHNTVIVDSQDSSEVWSSFRVARRAKPLNVSTKVNSDVLFVTGAHDGYRRLRGKVTHCRSFRLIASRLEITDDLDGSFDLAEANFLLHPEVDVALSSGRLVLGRGERSAEFKFRGGQAEVCEATWHPEFGKSIATRKIKVKFLSPTLTSTLTWMPDHA